MLVRHFDCFEILPRTLFPVGSVSADSVGIGRHDATAIAVRDSHAGRSYWNHARIEDGLVPIAVRPERVIALEFRLGIGFVYESVVSEVSINYRGRADYPTDAAGDLCSVTVASAVAHPGQIRTDRVCSRDWSAEKAHASGIAELFVDNVVRAIREVAVWRKQTKRHNIVAGVIGTDAGLIGLRQRCRICRRNTADATGRDDIAWKWRTCHRGTVGGSLSRPRVEDHALRVALI